MFSVESEPVEDTKFRTTYPARSFYWLVKEKIPLVWLAGLDALLTIRAQGAGHQEFAFSLRLKNAIVCYVRCLEKFVWPVWLAPHYPHPGNSIPIVQVAGSLALLLVVTALVTFGWRRRS